MPTIDRDRTSIDQAVAKLLSAYEDLRRAGLSERFLELAVEAADQQSSAFFGSFGDQLGCFLQFQTSDSPGEVMIRFGVRRGRAGWFSRLCHVIVESWSALWNKDAEYEIHLKPVDVGKLKDMLRFLERP